MKRLFFCPNCKLKFTTEGKLKEWRHQIYGVCRKRVASCPKCGKEVDEKEIKFGKKKKCSSCQGKCFAGNCQCS
ncbi:MAG: hypothetical protein ACPLKP_01860 [Microgenomates group bacterium]